jgi:5-methylcytosine-specific restriction endonuclease McrA
MREYAKQFSKPSGIKDWYRYATPDDAQGLEVHHIVAVVDGGSNCTENAMLLCFKCHLARKGKGGIPTGRDSKQVLLTD